MSQVGQNDLDSEASTRAGISHRWLVLWTVAAAQFMFVVNAVIVNVAIASIRADLTASSAVIQAVVAVYLAEFRVRLRDRSGRSNARESAISCGAEAGARDDPDDFDFSGNRPLPLSRNSVGPMERRELCKTIVAVGVMSLPLHGLARGPRLYLQGAQR